MTAPRGMARKAGDDHVVPLCGAHHTELHRDARPFEKKWRLVWLAKNLWGYSQDPQRGYDFVRWNMIEVRKK